MTAVRITLDYAATLVTYDPSNGFLTWLPREVKRYPDKAWNTRFASKRAGSLYPNGYWVLSVYPATIYAHRLAWYIIHGAEPRFNIDHIDGDKTNNRPENLRDVTQSKNMQNSCLRSDNKSGYIGVHWSTPNNRWQAQVTIEGKDYDLGRYVDVHEAGAAVKKFRDENGFIDRSFSK